MFVAHCTLTNDLSGLSESGDKSDTVREPAEGNATVAPVVGSQEAGAPLDLCPGDPIKTAPGACGCGQIDVDIDGDGVADCDEGCTLEAGCKNVCSDDPGSDHDGDGTTDCEDACPYDSDKVSAGVCGCGTSDADSDGDGTPDCRDDCPGDPNKQAFGACGCGVTESDSNGNDVPDCAEVSAVVFLDDFESGMHKWDVHSAWTAVGAPDRQPPGHGTDNWVASARDCYRCGMASVPIDTSGALGLELTFYRYVSGGLDASDEEYLDLWVHADGESSFVHSWAPMEAADSEWRAERFDLTPYAAGDLTIGFYGRSNDASEVFQIDDVVLTMTSRTPVVLNRPGGSPSDDTSRASRRP